MENLDRLCIHTITCKPWSIDQSVANFAKAGGKGITVWRDAIEGRDLSEVRRMIGEAGLATVSLCRGGFFPAADEAGRQKAIDDNRKAVDEAAAIGAPLVVLVCGAVPGQPLATSRDQIAAGIEAVLPHAKACGVKLAVEPLHPMYADARSAINTMGQANELCARIADPFCGIAVDTYHLWWDPDLQEQIRLSGERGTLLAFHVCDWMTPTSDLLLDRGLMGEGCINNREIREWVDATGYDGFIEVEVFSKRHWERDQHEFLADIVKAYREHV